MSTYSKWLLTILSVVAVLSGATYFHRYRKDHCKERLKAQASEFAIMNEGEVRACYGDLTTSAALDTHIKSLGLASGAELTWSERHDAFVAIAKGRFADGNTGGLVK